MDDLDGRVAVVTGGGGGLGRAIAEAFGGQGMKVVLADVRPALVTEAVDALGAAGTECVGATVDVRDAAAVEELAAGVVARFGRVDVICNNAGISVPGRQWELTLDDWDAVIGVCLWGVVNGVRSFVPRILEGGRGGHVVNVASMSGLLTSPGIGPYTAAKHGVVGLSKGLRAESVGASDKQLASIDRTAEGLAAAAIPPSEAADLVLEAVQGNHFWVLPNGAEHLESVAADVDELRATPTQS